MAGVFGLRKVYIQQASNTEGDDALELNIPGLGYGYFVAGQSGYPTPTNTNMVRFDLTTDTQANPSNNISQSRYYIYGLSGPNAGYTMGGFTAGSGGSTVSTADRVDFSNETTSTIANTPTERVASGGMGNNLYGYLCGGQAGPPPQPNGSRFDRLDFNTETWSLPGNPATTTGIRRTTLTNSSYSYVAGGADSPYKIVDRFDFSNDSVSQPFTLTVGKDGAHGVASPEYGFIVAGTNPASPPYGSSVERLEFSNETMSSPGNNMPTTRGFGTQAYNSNHAIIGLGLPPTGTPWATCTVDRLDFATETASALTPTNGRRAGPAGIQVNRPQVFKYAPGNSVWKEEPNQGFYGGGQTPTPTIIKTVDRIDFSNETVSSPPSSLTQARRYSRSVENSSYGYFAGGSTPSAACTIDRLDFSNETIVAPTSSLTQARMLLLSTQSSSYGYFAGGSPPNVCTIDRLDFSNETVSAPGTYQLTQARSEGDGTYSDSYGYFGGGLVPPNSCTIDRIDFSNETVSNPPASLTQARRNYTTTQNSSYGYFGGSDVPNSCTIDRIDFSNETVSNPPASLTQNRGIFAATQTSSYGYFGAGATPTYVCTIDRLDFSTETVTAPGPQLTQARNGLAAVSGGIATRRVGKATYGYFAGGESPGGNSSIIDRTDFATETSAPSAVLPKLSSTRQQVAGGFNSNYGYWAGGGPPEACTIDRLDFSNETTRENSSQLTQARRWFAGVSNSNYAYFAGGYTGSAFSTVIDRLDFATESVSSPGSYNLPQARNGVTSVWNSDYGYWGGGFPRCCTIDRLDFSSETTSVPSSSLTQDRDELAAVSSKSYGYFAGGSVPGACCTIDRIDFTTEVVSTNPGQLTQARTGLTGSYGSEYGYFAGGIAPGNTSTIDRLDFAADTVSLPSQSLTQARTALTGIANG